MTQEDLYDNVVVSLIRFVEDFRKEFMADADYVEWDGHAELSELPKKDVIGMAGCGLAEDQPGLYEVVFGVQVSTWGDPNLGRLRKLVSRLRGRLVPETRITVYNHDTAAEDSWLVTATPLAVLPVARAETRAIQAVEVRALLSPAAASPVAS